MKLTIIATALFFLSSFFNSEERFETVYFVASDNVRVSADLYVENSDNDFIILLHQAGSSRGEYRESALRLLDMGYNCLAIDLRSGRSSNDVPNLTTSSASGKGKGTGYLDARTDIEAAITYVFQEYDKNSILLGSSYSASLAMMIGKENEKVDAVIAFSPGEYLKKDKVSVAESIKSTNKPTFLAGSASEINQIEPFFEYIEAKNKVMFLPVEGEGAHGSRALWLETPNNSEYWKALESFLKSL